MVSRVPAALSVLLFLGAAHASSTRYLCSMTGQVSTHCCCAGDDPAGQTRVEADSECCDVLRSGGELPAATLPRLLAATTGPPVAFLPPQPKPFDPAQAVPVQTAHARAPPPRTPELFTLHCSFLI